MTLRGSQSCQIRLPENIIRCRRIRENGKVNIVTSTSIFVPKPFTPSPMGTDEYKGAGEGKAFLFVGQDQKSASTQRVSSITVMMRMYRSWRVCLPEETAD